MAGLSLRYGRSAVRLRNQCTAHIENPELIVFGMESYDPASKTREIFINNGDTLPARFNVDSNDIVKGAKIGEGNLVVYRAHWKGRGLDVAVKEFGCENTFASVKTSALEVTRMLNVRHPNVLKLYGFYLKAQEDHVLQCSMVMELMDCDLDTYIEKRLKDRSPFSDDEVVYIVTEIARGMQHVHKSGYFHRDLKPKNVLIKKSLVTNFHAVVKIADFGSSEALADGKFDLRAGTRLYKAPEQFDGGAKLVLDVYRAAKLDVYSFGCICFKLLTGDDPPFKDPSELIKRLDAKCGERNLPEVVGIIKNCVAVTPEARPDFEEICGILGPALEEIWSRQARPQATSRSTSSRPPGDDRERKGRLKSIVVEWGLPEDYIDYVIPSEELFVRREWARGGSGDIYEVEWNGIVYAMKVFYFDTYLPESVWRARLMLPKLVHKNIVTFMGYTKSRGNLAIIMEILHIDVRQFLNEEEERRKFEPSGILILSEPSDIPILSERLQWDIMKGIAEGMAHLHGKGVCHGDLKPQNVMVSAWNTEDVIVKLIDFNHDALGCTSAYAAPEVLVAWGGEKVDDKKADVYSFGITCSQILASRGTSGTNDWLDFSWQIWLRDYKKEVIDGTLRPKLPRTTRADLKRLLKRCWDGEPRSRPDFSEICQFFAQHFIEQHNEPEHNNLQHREPFRELCTLL